jgi:hypothetical protein
MTDIKAELDALFDWNPPPSQPFSNRRGWHPLQSYPTCSFYDMHIADRLILKRIVHVKHLHKKIACVVDEKLRSMEEKGTTLPPPTTPFITEERRLGSLAFVNTSMKRETSIQEFYSRTTSSFCVYVASTLAFHPKIWSSVLDWSVVPNHSGYAICDGSLQIPKPTRKKGPTGDPLPFAWDFIEPDKRKLLMEVKRRYKDLATWEMKSLSVGDRDAMLGVITMAVTEETFKWNLCRGEPCVAKNKEHITWDPLRGLDAPETLALVTTPWYDHDLSEEEQSQTSQLERTQEDIWDDSLKRGGSSLKVVSEFLLNETMKEEEEEEEYWSSAVTPTLPSERPHTDDTGIPRAPTAGGSETISRLPSASIPTPDIWKARSPPTVESTIGDQLPTRTTLLSVPTFKEKDLVRGELTAQKLVQQVNTSRSRA